MEISTNVAILGIACLTVTFGSICVLAGLNSVLPTSVVGVLATLGGYLIGKREASSNKG